MWPIEAKCLGNLPNGFLAHIEPYIFKAIPLALAEWDDAYIPLGQRKWGGLEDSGMSSVQSFTNAYFLAQLALVEQITNMSDKRSNFKTKIDEELMCGICHDRLNQPKTLTQCSHTFCQGCLEEYFAYKRTQSNPNSLECPKCRQITVFPQGRVAELPTNCTLQNMAEIMSEEPDYEQESKPELVCKTHEGILDQYCCKCNELLCSKCIRDPKHKEHLQKIDLAHRILPERLDTLTEKLEPATSLVTRAGEIKQKVGMTKEKIASNREETKGAIDVFFKNIKKRLEDRERLLISAVEQNANMKLAALEEHSQMLEESQMSAVKATEAINRLCQTRDIHCLTEDQSISEDIRQCQQSLEELDAELSNPDLNLILKLKEDTSLESQLSTLGSFTECECDTSNYLTVKYQLTVGRDGKVFKISPVPSTPYIVVTEGDENYAQYAYGRARSAATPNSTEQPVISRPPHSPTTGRRYESPYLIVPATQHVLPPQQHPGSFHARNSASLIRPQLQFHRQTFSKPPPLSSRDEALYDKVPLEIELPQNLHQSRLPLPANDGGVYEELSRHVPAPQLLKHPSVTESRRVLNTDSQQKATESGSDSGGDHAPISGWAPTLPPNNTTRKLAGKRTRVQTMPYNSTHQPRQLYKSVLIPPPCDRHEPAVIEPVQVITTQQLCHTSSIDKVYPVGIQCASGSDNIMITDVHNHCLKQLDNEGSVIEAIGCEGKDVGQFKEPTALAIGAGYMYITDLATNGRLQKFSKYGLLVNKCGKRHLRKPKGVAISQKDQSIYISDCQKRRVYIYDRNCKYVGSIGKAGDVRLEYPVGIAFDTAGNLLVVDRGQQCACIWQIDISKPKAEIIAKIGEGYLHCPFGITVTQDGSIVVTEQGNLNCVSVFSSRGDLIQCLGKTGSKPGMFNSPSGVTVNCKGQIIVADTHNQRLQVFSLNEEK